MADTKKNILTYAGLKQLEDELHELKVVKRQEVAQVQFGKKRANRATCLRMQSMMLQKTSRETSKHVLKKWKKF